MNDSRFIELLNLYVDHQISAEDAALLESEIQRSPERRRIYRQYCQMQKACVILAENFRTEAPAGDKVVAFPGTRRHRLGQVVTAFGALAAAACVALVMVNRTPTTSGLGDSTAAVSTETARTIQPLATAAPAAPLPAPARVALQPVFAGFESDRETPRFIATNANQVPLDWMDRIQLRKVTTEELWLDQRPASEPQDLLFRSPRRFQGPAEMTAWRFQK